MLQTQPAGHLCDVITMFCNFRLLQINGQQNVDVRLRRKIAACIRAVQIGVMDMPENRTARSINAVQNLFRLISGTHIPASNLFFLIIPRNRSAVNACA